MSFNTHLVTQQPAPSHTNVDSYLGSARPYVKHYTLPSNDDPLSIRKLELPYVSKFLIFHNHEHGNSNKSIIVTFYNFDDAYLNGDYLEIHGGEFTSALEVKCKDIWMRTSSNHTAKFDIIVGCTNVPRHNFPDDLLKPTTGGVGVLAHNNCINVVTV